MTTEPGALESEHDDSLRDVEQECWYDAPMKMQVDETIVVEGVN